MKAMFKLAIVAGSNLKISIRVRVELTNTANASVPKFAGVRSSPFHPLMSLSRKVVAVAEMDCASRLGGTLRGTIDIIDLLTSNVFGSFEYIPPEDGLVPLLMGTVKQDLSNYSFKDIGKISDVTYKFWKKLKVPTCVACEPDVIVNFTDERKNKIIVLVEAKFRSGKSSKAESNQEKPYDQLAKEWDNLVCIAKRSNSKPYLLYITADMDFPIKDIEDSKSDYKRTRGNDMEIVWMSWRKLPTIFQKSKQRIIQDLVEILRNQGLIFFEGFKVESVEHPNWSFTSTIKRLPTIEGKYDWSHKIQNITWKYNKDIDETKYNWGIGKIIGINWRYEK